MSLTKKVRQEVLQDISRTDVRFFRNYAINNGKLINSLLVSGVLSESDIYSAIDSAIVSQALEDYHFLINNQNRRRIYPDHDIIRNF